jgi:hypothetical protein
MFATRSASLPAGGGHPFYFLCRNEQCGFWATSEINTATDRRGMVALVFALEG